MNCWKNWRPRQAGAITSAANARQLAQEISYSEAGITAREMKDLWDMPAVFLAVIALRSAEWLLRRKWGAGMRGSGITVRCCVWLARGATYYVTVAGLGGSPNTRRNLPSGPRRWTANCAQTGRMHMSKRFAELATRQHVRRC